MTVHYLKIKPEYYKDVECGLKTFELRKNDRDFQVGDILMLIKLDGDGNETDQVTRVRVTYILKDCPQYGLKEGYAILGINADSREFINIKDNGGILYVTAKDLETKSISTTGGNPLHVTLNGAVSANPPLDDDIKQRIDDAEEELRELFKDLIYEHNDNEGEHELNNLSSGFNTLLKYAREWQKINEEGKK